MEHSKNRFLQELSQGLGNHLDKESILREYEAHIEEIILEAEDCSSEEELAERILNRLGTPREIAELWREELAVTPSKMKWLFILLNIFFFIGGGLLTLVHNLFDWKWLVIIWKYLTAIPTLIAFPYMFFWALLGYEMGRGFGHAGRKFVRNTFLFSLIPNLILMVLTVFEVIPHNWFAPLLTKTFIIACIIYTILLYPICILGFHWGKKASI